MEKIKSKKGITIVSLIMSIIILLIFSTVATYTVKSSNKVTPYNKMIADITALEDKILIYYNKYGEIPNQNIEEEIDGVKYYKIDLNKLENLTLNYGTEKEEGDYYLVSSNLRVYYKMGVEQAGTIYHTK